MENENNNGSESQLPRENKIYYQPETDEFPNKPGETQGDPAISHVVAQVVNAETETPDENPLEGITVYIVDDEPAIARITAKIIKSAGGVEITTDNGEECLSLLQAAGKNIAVLTDYSMPEMNGLEVAKAIRQFENGKNIPVIMVSGGGLNEAEIQAALMDETIDAFVGKPFMPDDIILTVREIFDKKNA